MPLNPLREGSLGPFVSFTPSRCLIASAQLYTRPGAEREKGHRVSVTRKLSRGSKAEGNLGCALSGLLWVKERRASAGPSPLSSAGVRLSCCARELA